MIIIEEHQETRRIIYSKWKTLRLSVFALTKMR